MTTEILADYSKKEYFTKILFSVLILLIVPFISAFLLHRTSWAFDTIFFGIIYFFLYLIKRFLNLTPLLFLLLGILVLAHCYAVFGFFKMKIFGHEYDTYVHFYSSIIIAMISFNYFTKFKIPYLEILFMALLITLGMGLLNEIIEFIGYKLFGTGEGFFLLGPGDIGDTNAYENLMTDFLNDFLGNLLGLFLISLYYLKRRK